MRFWRALIGFIVVVVLVGVGVSIVTATVSQPKTVPVLYEPDPPPLTAAGPEPLRTDYQTVTLPPAEPMLDHPDAPDGHVYRALVRTRTDWTDEDGTVWTAAELGPQPNDEYVRTVTGLAWRWYQSAMCYRWNLTQDSQGNWTVEKVTGLTCQEVADYYGDNLSLAKAIEYFSDYTADVDNANKTKVVKAGNADPKDIPSYRCAAGDRRDNPDTEAVEFQLCELQPSTDLTDADYAPSVDETTWTVDTLTTFQSDYTVSTSWSQSDRKRATAAYDSDWEYVVAENAARRIRNANRVPTEVFDQAAYDTAWAAWSVLRDADREAKTAWREAVNDYKNDRPSGMFVDCRLTGCVVVNSAR